MRYSAKYKVIQCFLGYCHSDQGNYVDDWVV